MDFNTDYIYQLEKKSGTVLKSIFNVADCTTLSFLNKENLLSTEPDDLSSGIFSLVAVLDDLMKVALLAASTIEKMKNDQISNQGTVVKLQEELLENKNEKLRSIQSTKQRKSNAVFTTFVREEERQKNVILFGLTEREADQKELGGQIQDVLESACGPKKPRVKGFSRIGKVISEKTRPVKVNFHSRDDVLTIVSHARYLKMSEKYSTVFISPDRSPEERAERKKLVGKLRKKRKEEPDRFHFISKGEVCSREHSQESGKLIQTQEAQIENSSFAPSGIFYSSLSRHIKLMEEKIDSITATARQAASLSKSMVS